jgi:hypothetical protein
MIYLNEFMFVRLSFDSVCVAYTVQLAIADCDNDECHGRLSRFAWSSVVTHARAM